MKRTTWFIFFLFLAVSCLDTPDCFRINNDLVGVTFRVMGSSKVDSVKFKSLVYAGFLLNQQDTVITQLSLPLNYFQNQAEIFFENEEEVKSLMLGYNVQTQFISDECGTRYVLSELTALNHNFDSLRIVNTKPGIQPTRNIEIFRCPVTDIVTISFRQLVYNAAASAAARRTSNALGVNLAGISSDNGGLFYQNTGENIRHATVKLPVNLSAAATTYTFDFNESFTRELLKQVLLTVNYDVTTTERYSPCGVQDFVSRLTIVPSAFDSVSIVRDQQGQFKDQLLDPHETNINIFRCPQTNLVQMNFRKTIPDSENTRQDTARLSGIRTNYSQDVFYKDSEVTTVTLPLNDKTTSTTFYFDYTNGQTESVTISYTVIQQQLFRACSQQPLFSKLKTDVEKFKVLLARDSIQFPPVSNIEVIN